MVRTIFVNPFKNHDVSEFPGVLQPLDEAPHRASVSAPRTSIAPPTSERRMSEKSEKDDVPRRPISDASSGVVNHGMTVETLKAEILADVAASDTDTPYDRKARICNHEDRVLTVERQVQSYQQGTTRHGHGPIPVGAIRSMRWWLDGR
jgi:hypothetical protein